MHESREPGILNASYVEEMYRRWREAPETVSPDWRRYLEAAAESGEAARARAGTRDTGAAGAGAGAPGEPASDTKQGRVDSLIWAYRDVGYVHAETNPLQGYQTPALRYLHKSIEGVYESLSLASFDLSEEDLDRVFSAGRGRGAAPLRSIIASFKQTYCSYFGPEILHIQNKPIRRWLIENVEANDNRPSWEREHQERFLHDLIEAEEFERFLQRTYIGQKRFSLEGAEGLIPALHYLVDTAARTGIKEIVLGMAHRGRINVLANIMHKPPEEIFASFEDQHQPHMFGGSGDVKYHLGYSREHRNEDGSSIAINLLPNPSHLESVDPVVEGTARGIQGRRGDVNRKKVLPVLIHGDAAFTGQGVVSETFNLSRLRGYRTGGTVHIVVNNQIGFTTAAADARSSFFPTDVAKSISIPIFHVNGDRVEYVVRAVDLALRFRQKFGYDVVVEIVCYRRQGHNEADEPSFTHPLMYRLIEKHPGPAEIYGGELDRRGIVGRSEQDAWREAYRQRLASALKKAREAGAEPDRAEPQSRETRAGPEAPATGVPKDKLALIAKHLTEPPKGMQIHRKLARILDTRKKLFESGEDLDWGFCESLAFGSLLLEGTHVRLSGEDCGRGTFSQRHAVWWDISTDTPRSVIPLNTMTSEQAEISIFDSPLSEFSILAFEYGYSLARPDCLVLWEAQFGDFANGAQVIIDQFIAAGEAKWNRASGLVMLLPHGYEGQGPEHSSAHLERYLQLCAEDNFQVANPSTPGQYFHLLRRQTRRPVRRPLVIMTPKSLLRRKAAVSSVSDLSGGSFQEVLDDPAEPRGADTVLFCSGKIFYDLADRRDSLGDGNASGSERGAPAGAAVVRVEQLCPFPRQRIERVLAEYPGARRFVWVQEEPRNRGAWSFMRDRLAPLLAAELEYVGRPESASPATGYYVRHAAELERILRHALRKAAAAPAKNPSRRKAQ